MTNTFNEASRRSRRRYDGLNDSNSPSPGRRLPPDEFRFGSKAEFVARLLHVRTALVSRAKPCSDRDPRPTPAGVSISFAICEWLPPSVRVADAAVAVLGSIHRAFSR